MQLRTSYPEDTVLVPVFYLALIIVAFGILAALVVSFKNSFSKSGEKLRVKPALPKIARLQPYLKLDAHLIRLDESQVQELKDDGYEIVYKTD
jgi:hypothetical protein